MLLKNSVSDKTNQALSKPTQLSVFSDKTNSVFSKTNSFRTKSSTAVHTTIYPKGKTCASDGEAKKIAFFKAKPLASTAKHQGGVSLALHGIKASNSEVKNLASLDAQLASNGEAIRDARLALNGEAIRSAQLAVNDEANALAN